MSATTIRGSLSWAARVKTIANAGKKRTWNRKRGEPVCEEIRLTAAKGVGLVDEVFWLLSLLLLLSLLILACAGNCRSKSDGDVWVEGERKKRTVVGFLYG